MIRFLLNFIGFGILFYLIYLFFPEGFKTLVSWADQVYEFLRSVVLQVEDKIHNSSGTNTTPTHVAKLAVFFLK